MEFEDKVGRECEELEHSAVAYIKAGAREEGEVMGVVESLRTNSREISEQVCVCCTSAGFCVCMCVHDSMCEVYCNGWCGVFVLSEYWRFSIC